MIYLKRSKRSDLKIWVRGGHVSHILYLPLFCLFILTVDYNLKIENFFARHLVSFSVRNSNPSIPANLPELFLTSYCLSISLDLSPGPPIIQILHLLYYVRCFTQMSAYPWLFAHIQVWEPNPPNTSVGLFSCELHWRLIWLGSLGEEALISQSPCFVLLAGQISQRMLFNPLHRRWRSWLFNVWKLKREGWGWSQHLIWYTFL